MKPLSIALFAAIALAFDSASAATGLKPNILLVLIDDMGWSDLSCFGGQTPTPSIDRLAREGLRFTNFYVNASICSPSRVALLTGQYPQRWRISSYLETREANQRRGMAQWLDPKAPVLARELKAGGYATGHFGKWHMGGQRDVGDAPLITDYGFDQSLTNFEGLGPRVLPLTDAYDGRKPGKHDLGSANLGHGPIRWEDRSVITTAYTSEASAFIDQSQAAGRPFFVHLWPDDVHSPFFPPKTLRQGTDGSKRAFYQAVLKAMDQQIGPLFDRIRSDEKLRDNTLILLASDNGPEPGAGSAAPLRGAKGSLYEGGSRSPLIVWGPGLMAPGKAGTTNSSSVICSLDLNRSLYALTGTPLPASATLDGEDFSDTFLGKSERQRKTPIFWRRPPDRAGTKDEPNPDLGVRDGQWKAYVTYDGQTAQLYDLLADVSETKNVATAQAEVTARLVKAMLDWNAALPPDAGDTSIEKTAGDKTLPPGQFINPIGEGADPWVIRDPNAPRYLWCMSDGNRAIAVHLSDHLSSMGEKHIVWRAPDAGPYSQQVWAPELHFIDGLWHIYTAASDGKNENHRAFVLRSKTADPLGPYEFHGPFATGDGPDRKSPNIWAIDMTVLEHQGQRYAIWSGWDAPGTDRQYLYIAPMKSPTELAAPRVRLCANDNFPWERTESGAKGRGLHEGPEVLRHGNRCFLTYSCGASWLPNYKLGLLELTGSDPLDPAAWKKFSKPVFEANETTYGIGHSCFVTSPDGKQSWHIFHAKRDAKPGWRRAIFVQPLSFGEKGFPLFGTPIAAGKPLPRPSGEPDPVVGLPYQTSLKQGADFGQWTFFGHHQFFDILPDGLHLGIPPKEPVNDFRSGEKMMLDAVLPAEFSAEVTIDFLGQAGARDAGILFRTSGAALGFDAQRGYFAGLVPKSGIAILGKTDGRRWTEIGRAKVELNVPRSQQLRVSVAGAQFTISLNGKSLLTASDKDYASGSLGLRVVDTHAVFSNLRIEPLARNSRPR